MEEPERRIPDFETILTNGLDRGHMASFRDDR